MRRHCRRCDCVAEGSPGGRPGTDRAPRGHPTPQALRRQQGSEDVPPEWGPASPRSSATSRGQDRAGGERTLPLDVLQRPKGMWVLGGPQGRPPHVLGLCLRLCLARGGGGLPAAGGLRAPPGNGDPDPHGCWSAAPLPAQGTCAEWEPTDAQLLGPKSQKPPTKVRSLCKLTRRPA